MQICVRDERERERESIVVRVVTVCWEGGGGGGCVRERGDPTDHLPMLDHLSVSTVQCTGGCTEGLYTSPATQTVSLSPATHKHRRATTLRYQIYLPDQQLSTIVNE